MTAYYNEIDPYAAQWLRNLIAAGHIAHGEVDERSIVDIRPSELAGFTQCHFFAGIGVWSYALRLAGWPDDRPVWTGSCPCQPFSQAGKGIGAADERHLWPSWFHLIEQCKPPVIFGEQVASPAGLGWFDTVHADLERADYAVGAADLCAAGVGAPHIRQRLYFVAESDGGERNRRSSAPGRDITNGADAGRTQSDSGAAADRETLQLADYAGVRSEVALQYSGLGDSNDAGLEGRRLSNCQCSGERSAWSPSDLIWCRDGKWRPVEPGTFPLAHGAPARVGRLRAYGNAIVAPLAKEFIAAYTGRGA